jgi:CIC family chloride channel protein
LFGALAIAFGLPSSSAAIFTVAGIAAVTGSVVGAPVGMVLIVMEFTGSYEFALAAVISVAMSSFVSTRVFSYSFFDHQLMLRGIDLRQGREVLSLRDVYVSSLELGQGVCVAETSSGKEVVEALKISDKTEAYVVDIQKKLVGRTTIVDALNHESSDVTQFMQLEYASLCESDDLARALLVARGFVGEAIPVTDDSRKFVGCISEGDILSGTMDWQEEIKCYERN